MYIDMSTATHGYTSVIQWHIATFKEVVHCHGNYCHNKMVWPIAIVAMETIPDFDLSNLFFSSNYST